MLDADGVDAEVLFPIRRADRSSNLAMPTTSSTSCGLTTIAGRMETGQRPLCTIGDRAVLDRGRR